VDASWVNGPTFITQRKDLKRVVRSAAMTSPTILRTLIESVRCVRCVRCVRGVRGVRRVPAATASQGALHVTRDISEACSAALVDVASLNVRRPRFDARNMPLDAKDVPRIGVAQRNEIVRILFENGAEADAQYGLALVCASETGDYDLVRTLLVNGAHPTANGDVAIQLARRGSHHMVLSILNDARVLALNQMLAAKRAERS